ncbi:hypothetical protein PGT21_003346 [Puccinia graminis f. sp. tritici]|uniref:Uncharacterized protein n=1 Tax=Puccinia graminis f. sp. tritici TaxID=56615 RepID=A0A5B0QE71_PUCGR|nr:hypothetical protein PGT21_003346 [Puccinia graminis f. sp. tritici]
MYRKVFERPSESLSNHISKCTWTKVQDVRPCGRIFRNISERTSEMFRTPAPVVDHSKLEFPSSSLGPFLEAFLDSIPDRLIDFDLKFSFDDGSPISELKFSRHDFESQSFQPFFRWSLDSWLLILSEVL